MVSIICSECGGEARTLVAQCPRCGSALEAPINEKVTSVEFAPIKSRRRTRAATACVAAFVGFALWSIQTPGAPENPVVAVGKVEAGEVRP